MNIPINTERLSLVADNSSRKVKREASNADLFSEGRGFMEDFHLTMQLQIGCPADCGFCYVRQGFRLAPSDVQKNWGYLIRLKQDIEKKFVKSLQAGRLADRTIYASGVTDNYATPPALMRMIWQKLINSPSHLRPRRFVTQTRFRADRDADLMAKYNDTTQPSDGGPATLVSLSVGTDRDDLIRLWERATPSFKSRLQAIQRLRQAGVDVVATLSPLGPWRDLKGKLRYFQDLGVSYITVLFFKERGAARTPNDFLSYLQQEFPCVLDPNWQADRIAEMEEIYGPDRVLVAKAGFTSLAAPHLVGKRTE